MSQEIKIIILQSSIVKFLVSKYYMNFCKSSPYDVTGNKRDTRWRRTMEEEFLLSHEYLSLINKQV